MWQRRDFKSKFVLNTSAKRKKINEKAYKRHVWPYVLKWVVPE